MEGDAAGPISYKNKRCQMTMTYILYIASLVNLNNVPDVQPNVHDILLTLALESW